MEETFEVTGNVKKINRTIYCSSIDIPFTPDIARDTWTCYTGCYKECHQKEKSYNYQIL